MTIGKRGAQQSSGGIMKGREGKGTGGQRRSETANKKRAVEGRDANGVISRLKQINLKLLEENRVLKEKNSSLQRDKSRLLKEKEQILENSAKLILYLRRTQEQLEEWNRQDGEFFEYIMPKLLTLCGCLAARNTEKAEAALADLKGQIYDSRKILCKDNQFKADTRTGWHLTADDLDRELQKFKKDKERYGKNVLYQNLLFPLLCILADFDLQTSDEIWKEEIDAALQAEGLRTLYYSDLPKEDVVNRSLFIEMNGQTARPGLFRRKEEGGYELFGNFQGFVRRTDKRDEC